MLTVIDIEWHWQCCINNAVDNLDSSVPVMCVVASTPPPPPAYIYRLRAPTPKRPVLGHFFETNYGDLFVTKGGGEGMQ